MRKRVSFGNKISEAMRAIGTPPLHSAGGPRNRFNSIDNELPCHADDGTAPTPRERALRTRLCRMLGADLTAIPTVGVETAQTVASEVGGDLSRFPTCAHFCSWLGLAPGTRISGDKRLGGPETQQTDRVDQALRMAASTARSSKTAIGASHRRLQRIDASCVVRRQGHCPPARPADLRHADPRRRVRRARSRRAGDQTPRPKLQEPAATSPLLQSHPGS